MHELTKTIIQVLSNGIKKYNFKDRNILEIRLDLAGKTVTDAEKEMKEK